MFVFPYNNNFMFQEIGDRFWLSVVLVSYLFNCLKYNIKHTFDALFSMQNNWLRGSLREDRHQSYDLTLSFFEPWSYYDTGSGLYRM